MIVRFLVDVSLGKQAEDWLKSSKHDVVTVRDIDPRLPDNEILHIAFIENRVVITLDKDFGELVYRTNQAHSGILLLRLEQQTSQTKIKVLAEILKHYASELPDHFCVYQNQRFRIR